MIKRDYANIKAKQQKSKTRQDLEFYRLHCIITLLASITLLLTLI